MMGSQNSWNSVESMLSNFEVLIFVIFGVRWTMDYFGVSIPVDDRQLRAKTLHVGVYCQLSQIICIFITDTSILYKDATNFLDDFKLVYSSVDPFISSWMKGATPAEAMQIAASWRVEDAAECSGDAFSRWFCWEGKTTWPTCKMGGTFVGTTRRCLDSEEEIAVEEVGQILIFQWISAFSVQILWFFSMWLAFISVIVRVGFDTIWIDQFLLDQLSSPKDGKHRQVTMAVCQAITPRWNGSRIGGKDWKGGAQVIGFYCLVSGNKIANLQQSWIMYNHVRF